MPRVLDLKIAPTRKANFRNKHCVKGVSYAKPTPSHDPLRCECPKGR